MSNILIFAIIIGLVVMIKFFGKIDLSKVSGTLSGMPNWIGFLKKAYFWITFAGIISINAILAYYWESWQNLWVEKLGLCLVTNLGILLSVIFLNEDGFGSTGKTVGLILASIVAIGFFTNSKLFGKNEDYLKEPPKLVEKTKTVEVQKIIAPVGEWSKAFKLDTTLETGHTETSYRAEKPIWVKYIGSFGEIETLDSPMIKVSGPKGTTHLRFKSADKQPVEVTVKQW